MDPARYTQMVIRAYDGARAGDPHILVIAGSLAPTGGTGDGRAMNDVDFLDAMYDAGLQDHFDAISTHNYGFGGEPEDKTWGSGILNFRRAEDLHAVMVAHGDGDLPVWGTEFGWLLESAECSSYWDQIGFAWQQVTAQQQADYLTRAFAYADANWPWMQTMIVSNLDFSVLPWYGTCDPLRYFAILNPDWSPRPAYTALDGMAKNPRSWSVFGMAVSPNALASMQLVTDTKLVTRQVTVLNAGEGDFGWTAERVRLQRWAIALTDPRRRRRLDHRDHRPTRLGARQLHRRHHLHGGYTRGPREPDRRPRACPHRGHHLAHSPAPDPAQLADGRSCLSRPRRHRPPFSVLISPPHRLSDAAF